MNNKKLPHQILIAACCVFALFIGACNKKEIQGPKGDAGTPGSGGNSNITTSDVFIIGTTQWQPTSADSSTWKTNYSTTLITKEAVSKGSVKLYMQIGSSWYELPYINVDLYTQYGYEEGIIKLTFSDIHGSWVARPATANYRLVILSLAGKTQLPEKSETVLNPNTKLKD